MVKGKLVCDMRGLNVSMHDDVIKWKHLPCLGEEFTGHG